MVRMIATLAIALLFVTGSVADDPPVLGPVFEQSSGCNPKVQRC